MNTEKRIFILTLALCMALALLLTACGAGGDTPDTALGKTPDTIVPETVPPEQLTDEPPTPPALQATELGSLSDGSSRYYSARCSFVMPEGWMCNGTGRLDDEAIGDLGGFLAEPIRAYFTSWGEPYDLSVAQIGGESLSMTKWNLTIIEYDDKITDFETVTAEEWYMSKWFYQEDEVPGNVGNLKTEMTVVDGNPAARVTWHEVSPGGRIVYHEFWAIDAPWGLVKISLFNGEVSGDEAENGAWTEDYISTFMINP